MAGLLESYSYNAYSTQCETEPWEDNGDKKSRIQPMEEGLEKLEQVVWAQLTGLKSGIQQ